jgi:hypothetical protein
MILFPCVILRTSSLDCTLRVCLDGERISEKIVHIGLVVENNVRLVISQEM